MPKFLTQYDARDRIITHPGNPIKQLYSGSYNERGQVELKEDGTEDLYAFIQSFAESTDIHAILKRYENGEVGTYFNRQRHEDFFRISNTLKGFGIGMRHFGNITVKTLNLYAKD